MLKLSYSNLTLEAGCDEAGRGCLCGPVFAAAVVLPIDFYNELLDDSKKLSQKEREFLRPVIEREAVCWAVGSVTEQEIDSINILNASFLAMHRALDLLAVPPEFLIIDGNRFTAYRHVPYQCIVKGDGKYASIAAASVLAKTYRDEYMNNLHEVFPEYGWDKNKGYATELHRKAISFHGITPYHRKSFNLNEQLKINFG
jgi:ribonuclease HII